MTRDDQATLVHDLGRRIVGEIVARIDRGDVPATWDGHELRELLALKFTNERTRLMCDGRKRRAQDFRNEYLTRNL